VAQPATTVSAITEANASATTTLPRLLGARRRQLAALEGPQELEECRGLLVELGIEPADPRARFLGLGQLALCDSTLHCADQ
jgi:hypothetical protein